MRSWHLRWCRHSLSSRSARRTQAAASSTSSFTIEPRALPRIVDQRLEIALRQGDRRHLAVARHGRAVGQPRDDVVLARTRAVPRATGVLPARHGAVPMAKGLRIQGSFVYSRAGARADFDIVLDLLRRQGKAIADAVITHRVPLPPGGQHARATMHDARRYPYLLTTRNPATASIASRQLAVKSQYQFA
jgi:hypothetical protein